MSSAELVQEIERFTKHVDELERKTENDATAATPSSNLNMQVFKFR
jgi:hypothetical protein